jgi:hypothetical protein
MLIASSGQASTQTPQSTQLLASTIAFSLAMLIASLGHSSTQVSQPVHFAGFTLAGIYAILSKKIWNLTLSEKMLQNSADITTQFFGKLSIKKTVTRAMTVEHQ